MNFFISRDKLIIWSVLCLVAVITGTIIGFKVEDGGIGLYATLAIISLGICPYVKRFILFVFVFCLCVICMQNLQRPKEELRCPGTGITDNY